MKIFLKKRLAIRIYLGLTLSEDIVGGCMSKLFSIFICFLFIIMSLPAYADWCRVQGGGVEQCGVIPSSWTECGSLSGEAVWCWPQTNAGSASSSKNKSSTNTLITVGVGVGFVVAMWYFFKTPPSSNSPGQVKLMAF